MAGRLQTTVPEIMNCGASTMNPAKTNTQASSSIGNRNVMPFSNLQGDALAALEGMGMQVHYTRGQRLFAEGERSRNVFFLLSGRIKLSVASREGRSVILRVAEPEQVLGLSAALSGNEHEITAESTEPCALKAIPTRD